MLGLELLELVQQRVELVVGDLGLVVDVVALFVVADLRRGARMRCGRADPSRDVSARRPATLGCRPSTRLPISRQDVVGQRQQRVAFAARRKRVERLLGALGVLDRLRVARSRSSAMLAQQARGSRATARS